VRRCQHLRALMDFAGPACLPAFSVSGSAWPMRSRTCVLCSGVDFRVLPFHACAPASPASSGFAWPKAAHEPVVFGASSGFSSWYGFPWGDRVPYELYTLLQVFPRVSLRTCMVMSWSGLVLGSSVRFVAVTSALVGVATPVISGTGICNPTTTTTLGKDRAEEGQAREREG
jgi:hypothetical protein